MKKNRNPVFFPILINLENFPCLVVGGGEVAYRKVLSLNNFNSKITVISPKVCKPLIELSEKGIIKIIKKPYSREYLKDYKIIFSATDNPQISKAVHKDCASKGILLNVADVPALCDFILPANILRGDLTISISSQGKAPFFTKLMKTKLEKLIPPIYKDIIELAGDFRKRILTKVKSKPESIKSNIFRKFTEVNWEKTFHKDGKKGSQKQFQKILTENNLL